MSGGIREFLPELISRVESGDGADREIDCLVAALADIQVEGVQHSWRSLVHQFGVEWAADVATRHTSVWRTEVPRYTASLDAVLLLMSAQLPGFWWRGGTCSVSSEARVCPDHNCPEHGPRLLAECPPSLDHWNEGIEVELRPGSQSALVRALLAACLRALQAKLPEHADANSKSPIQAREE